MGGTEEQKKRWLPGLASGEVLAGFALTEPDAGSDIASMRTVARREDDGWHLSGSKTFISNAREADLVVLFAKTDPSAGFRGITAFAVPKGTPGISYSEPQDKMGIRSAPTYTVYLDDVVLPHDAVIGTEGRGGNIALTALNRARIDVAAMANGIALRAWELGREYASERKQFGHPIFEFQAIQLLLGECDAKLVASRVTADWRPTSRTRARTCAAPPRSRSTWPPRPASRSSTRSSRSTAAPGSCASPRSSVSTATAGSCASSRAPRRSSC